MGVQSDSETPGDSVPGKVAGILEPKGSPNEPKSSPTSQDNRHGTSVARASPSASTDSLELEVYDAGSGTDASGTDGGVVDSVSPPSSPPPSEIDWRDVPHGGIVVAPFIDDAASRSQVRAAYVDGASPRVAKGPTLEEQVQNVFEAEDKFEAASAWAAMFEQKPYVPTHSAGSAADGSSALAHPIYTGEDKRATFKEMQPPPTYTVVKAAKIWFAIKAPSDEYLLLTFMRADADSTRPQLDTVGGRMDSDDNDQPSRTAVRELQEEISLPSQWLQAAIGAISVEPLGMVKFTWTKHSARELHHVYAWIIDVTEFQKGQPRLTQAGKKEAQANTLTFRRAEIVLNNLDETRLHSYADGLRKLLLKLAAPSRNYSPPATEATVETWRPRVSSIEARAQVSGANHAGPELASKPPPRLAHLEQMASGMGHALQATKVPPLPPKEAPLDRNLYQPAQERPLTECLPSFAGTLFEREIRLPVPLDFAWPEITRFAFYEDSGSMREAWGELGYIACSVADRPTQFAPSKRCFHFIGQVYDFVQCFPYAIDIQTSHVECGPASWSSWKTWPIKLGDGRMLEAAEELLWISSIGNRSIAEQPHTAHESILGPPTQIINAYEHGGFNKTWCLWQRNVGFIAPSDIVPVEERGEILSKASGPPEQKMLQRSRTRMQMARALVQAIDAYSEVPVHEPDRPAAEPCKDYKDWRRALRHNIGIVAASFAPTLSDELIDDTERSTCAFIMPLAPGSTGPSFLVPLQGSSVFGIELSGAKSAKEETEAASKLLSIGIETHHMHTMNNDKKDLVIAVPWDQMPLVIVATMDDMDAARTAGMPAVWATPEALQGTSAFEPAHYASMRCAAMSGAVMADHSNPGIWSRARPAILSKRAEEFGTRPASATAEAEWTSFLEKEASRKVIMQDDLFHADNGSGLIEGFRSCVRTAADYAAELPVPAQGLPNFASTNSLFVAAPQRPLPLHRDWLHRLPPQAVPPGFQPLRYDQVLRGWSRRMIARAYNRGMVYDAFCFDHGSAPSEQQRPASFTLGRGAAMTIKHTDGIGSYNAFDLLLELRDDGLYHPVDFTKPEKRVWVFEVIKEYLGTISNQEIMSFLFHGVCWKVNLRGQLHVSRNLARYDERGPQIAATIEKLSKAGYVDLVHICDVQDGLTPEGPSPLLYVPQNHVPIGGIDKGDGTARVVGDMSDPHDGQLLREKEHGEPDGNTASSLNELSGPKGPPKPSYTGPLPFPEPEIKPRPKDKYAACVYLTKYAEANGTFLVTMDDDMRQMFFQFFIREEDLYTCVWYIITKHGQVLRMTAVRVRTMNMGGRNASKIGCNFAEEWLDSWRIQMDDVTDIWLTKQSKALQEAYWSRRAQLGKEQARPFWAAVYTDNFDFTFCASDLAAIGTYVWRRMNERAKIELQANIIYGTCSDWIGGRFVLQGGFGCLTPSKRARAIEQCHAALNSKLTREDYESNNSFLGHVADICAWPKGALQGITGPLKAPGKDEDIVVLTAHATERYQNAIVLLEARSFASFESAVQDAYELWSGRGDAVVPIHTHASDCCTDPMPHENNLNPQPHVAGFVNGVFWRFKLTGRWLEKHITLTEAAGVWLNTLMTVPRFPHDINLLGTDATAAGAAGIGKAKSEQIQVGQRELEKCLTYKLHSDSCWYNHWKGWGNGIIDAISRDNLPLAQRMAVAFGVKLTEIPLTQEALDFMQRVLERTDEVERESTMQVEIRGLDGKHGTLDLPVGATAKKLLKKYVTMKRMGHGTHKKLRVIIEGHALSADEQVAAREPKGKLTAHIVLNATAGGLRDVPQKPSPIVTGAGPSGSGSTPTSGALKPAVTQPPVGPLCAQQSRKSPMLRSLSKRITKPKPSNLSSFLEQRRASPRLERQALQAADSSVRSLQCEQRAGSPQPTTARDARARASDQVAQRLASSTTEYAICPGDPSKLQSMIRDSATLRQEQIPKGTKAADEHGFKCVMEFAKSMGPSVRWMRPKLSDKDIDVEQEVWFAALALMFIAQHMQPSARRKERGYGEAQPTSALLAIYGWRRVLRDCGRYVCDSSAMKQVLNGLCQRYKRIWGQECFVKQQALILTKRMLLDIAAVCTATAVSGWSLARHKCWNAKSKFLMATGTRNDELCQDDDDDDCLMRSNIMLLDQGTFEPIEVNVPNLEAIKNGDIIGAITAPSKCDRLNVEWSKQRQYFRYNDKDPLNFAVAWVEYEWLFPCQPDDRHKWPAFSVTGDDAAPSRQQSANDYKRLLTVAIGEDDAKGRTIHSNRARLASALAAARASGGHPGITDAVIQMCLRWKTIQSLMSYNKTAPTVYADLVDLGTYTDAGPSGRDDTPVSEPDEVLNDLAATLRALDVSPTKRAAPDGAAKEAASSAGNKRAAPSPSEPASIRKPSALQRNNDIVVVGRRARVVPKGSDTWQLIGTKLDVPNEAWGEDDGESTTCTISHFLGKHTFDEGGQHLAYTVSPDDEPDANYPMRADFLLRQLPADMRAQLRKVQLTST